MKHPRPDKQDLVRPRRPCGREVAAEHLARDRCPAVPRGGHRLDPVPPEECRHPVEQVDVLDGGDKTDAAGFEEGDNPLEHAEIEIDPNRLIDHVGTLLHGRVAEVDQDIGIRQGVEREVAAAVTGVPADDHLKPRIPEGGRCPRRLSGKSGGKLEGDPPGAAAAELLDYIRDRYQQHAPDPGIPRP